MIVTHSLTLGHMCCNTQGTNIPVYTRTIKGSTALKYFTTSKVDNIISKRDYKRNNQNILLQLVDSVLILDYAGKLISFTKYDALDNNQRWNKPILG